MIPIEHLLRKDSIVEPLVSPVTGARLQQHCLQGSQLEVQPGAMKLVLIRSIRSKFLFLFGIDNCVVMLFATKKQVVSWDWLLDSPSSQQVEHREIHGDLSATSIEGPPAIFLHGQPPSQPCQIWW